jgi:hypothetical protein
LAAVSIIRPRHREAHRHDVHIPQFRKFARFRLRANCADNFAPLIPKRVLPDRKAITFHLRRI